MSNNNQVSIGQQTPNTTWGEVNNIKFAIQESINKIQTSMPVKVMSVTNHDDLSPVGFVDVLPLINQINPISGIPEPHTTIHKIPYFRFQGGKNAIIIDPKIGDKGLCVFSSRDTENFKETKDQCNPSSFRQYSFSDGFYFGGFLNEKPKQYVIFDDDKIKIHGLENVVIECDSECTITAPRVTINGNLVVNGYIRSTDDVTAKGTSVHTHKHGEVQSGNSETGEPI